jgi:hypothetical protein
MKERQVTKEIKKGTKKQEAQGRINRIFSFDTTLIA